MNPAPPFPLTLDMARELLRHDPMSVWTGFFPEELADGRVLSRMTVEQKHLAPTGFLHAAVVTAFADITCGLGAHVLLPDGQHSFATLEIKTNFLGTARKGDLRCEALCRHAGAETQVWDAEVRSVESGKLTALFRCTQIVLKPR